MRIKGNVKAAQVFLKAVGKLKDGNARRYGY